MRSTNDVSIDDVVRAAASPRGLMRVDDDVEFELDLLDIPDAPAGLRASMLHARFRNEQPGTGTGPDPYGQTEPATDIIADNLGLMLGARRPRHLRRTSWRAR